MIAKLGNTGNANASHMHFHLMNGPSVLGSDGLPYVIDRFSYAGQVAPQALIDADDYLSGQFLQNRLPTPATAHRPAALRAGDRRLPVTAVTLTRPPHQRHASTDAVAPNPTAVTPEDLQHRPQPGVLDERAAHQPRRPEHGQNEQHTEDGAPGPLIHRGPLYTGNVDHHSHPGCASAGTHRDRTCVLAPVELRRPDRHTLLTWPAHERGGRRQRPCRRRHGDHVLPAQARA